MPNDFFKRVKAKFLVCDEAQMIKNPATQMAKAVTHFLPMCPNVLCLSGTIIKNNAKEYYTVLHMTQPGMFPTEANYVAEHVRSTLLRADSSSMADLKNPEHFKELTKNFIIRHRSERRLTGFTAGKTNYSIFTMQTLTTRNIIRSSTISWRSSRRSEIIFRVHSASSRR